MSKITLQLETSKESAKQLHNQLRANSPCQPMRIYTDGSGIANKIGAATFNPTTNEVDHQHLGSDEHFNVYAGELTAIHIAVSHGTTNQPKQAATYLPIAKPLGSQ